MQLLPETYEWLSKEEATDENIFDPEKNILYGTKYLSILYTHYKKLLEEDNFYKNCDVWDIVHAAYHAGNGRVDKWLHDGSIIIDSNGNISKLPIKTTKVYIDKINEAKKAYIKILDKKETDNGLQST
jgi:soluble lytic murein transglycosylase-like protein